MPAATLAPEKPNVVYVFSDTHRWCSMSFTETPELHTPNMFALKQHGVAVNNCYSSVQTYRCVITKDFMFAAKTKYRPIVAEVGGRQAKKKNGKKKKAERQFGESQPAGDWCLYDRKQDPLQMKNLVADPAYRAVKEQMRAKLEAWIAKAETPFAEDCFRNMNETCLANWNIEHGSAADSRAQAIAAYHDDFSKLPHN